MTSEEFTIEDRVKRLEDLALYFHGTLDVKERKLWDDEFKKICDDMSKALKGIMRAYQLPEKDEEE